MLALAVALATSAHAVDLEVGPCPGPSEIRITDATPGASVAIVTASAPGGVVIPAGPCADVASLDIGPAGLALRTTVRADGGGNATLSLSLPDFACGLYIQAVDFDSCETSAPSVIGEGGDGGVIWAADSSGGLAGGLYRIDMATGTASLAGPLSAPITDLATDDTGALWGIGGSWDHHGEIHLIDSTDASSTIIGTLPLAEASLGFWGGMLYAVDQFTAFYTVDPDTAEATTDPLGPGFLGMGYGFALAADASGRLFYVNEAEVYEVDPATGSFLLLTSITGMPLTTGGGATFHEGALYLTGEDPLGTQLYVVDLLSGVATPTGIVLPSGNVDALGSATP